MADTNFDIIIIGSGPGGYVTAIRAAQLGFKTAIVATIQAEMAKAARDGEVRRRLGDVGAEVMGSTQEELGKVLHDQVAVVRPLVEELKLVVQ